MNINHQNIPLSASSPSSRRTPLEERAGVRRLVILGAGESGVGAAILAQQKGFDVFVSDFGAIKDVYQNELNKYNIPF